MDSNQTKKYFLYAIGEVVLVVIGILIALQINNWNEEKKERVQEVEILHELQENLELNVDKLESQIDRKELSDISSRIILDAIEKKLPFHDSLSNHLGWGLSFEDPGPLSKSGYESFKNTGTDILRNKRLKREIIHLFEDTYAESETRMDRILESSIELVRLRQENMMRTSNFNFVPFDYRAFINDDYIHSWVKTVISSRRWGTNALRHSLVETEKVLQLIKDELAI